MRVPSIRKHCSGQARVTIKGKDYLLGPYGSNEAKTQYEQLIAEYLANGFIKPKDCGGMLLPDVLAMFLEYLKTYATRNEQLEFKSVVLAASEKYEDLPAREFSVSQYRAVRLHMVSKGWVRNVVNRRMQRLLFALKWAVTEKLFDVNEYQILKLVEPLKAGRCTCPESEPVKPVDDKRLKIVLARVSPIVHDMIQLQRLTGARPSEICNLTPGAIDRSETVWISALGKHKTAYRNKKRKLAFGPLAQKILAKYLFRDPDAHCFSPAESQEWHAQQREAARTTPKTYGNQRGSNRVKKPKREPGAFYTTASYRRVIHRACEAAGIEKWAPNQIRHLRATEVRKEFGVEAAQILLGHSSIRTTEIYAERDEGVLIEVAGKIG